MSLASLVRALLLVLLCGVLKNVLALERRSVTERGLVGDFYYTKGATEQRPIVVFGGSGGGNYFNARNLNGEVTAQLEKDGLEGYAILALSYFDYRGTDGIPSILKDIPNTTMGRCSVAPLV